MSSVGSWAALVQLSKADLAVTTEHLAARQKTCCVHALGKIACKLAFRAVGNIPLSCCFSLALSQVRCAAQQGWLRDPRAQ